jgi:hypothetical protein
MPRKLKRCTEAVHSSSMMRVEACGPVRQTLHLGLHVCPTPLGAERREGKHMTFLERVFPALEAERTGLSLSSLGHEEFGRPFG